VTSASNREIIADLYRSFVSDDPNPMLAAFNDDSIWVEAGTNLRSGVYSGVSEIVRHSVDCRSLTDATIGTDVLEILAGERFVVVVERALALRNGTTLNMLCNDVFEMADGAVTHFRILPFDPGAWDAFWS
jgi:ketosteroid isomerase-like protein